MSILEESIKYVLYTRKFSAQLILYNLSNSITNVFFFLFFGHFLTIIVYRQHIHGTWASNIKTGDWQHNDLKWCEMMKSKMRHFLGPWDVLSRWAIPRGHLINGIFSKCFPKTEYNGSDRPTKWTRIVVDSLCCHLCRSFPMIFLCFCYKEQADMNYSSWF